MWPIAIIIGQLSLAAGTRPGQSDHRKAQRQMDGSLQQGRRRGSRGALHRGRLCPPTRSVVLGLIGAENVSSRTSIQIPQHLEPRKLAVVCVKFSKLVMVRVRRFIQVTRAASLCSIGNDHPFVPTCPPAERRAQRQSRMPPRTRRHRRSRRAASLTERARC